MTSSDSMREVRCLSETIFIAAHLKDPYAGVVEFRYVTRVADLRLRTGFRAAISEYYTLVLLISLGDVAYCRPLVVW